MNVLVAYCPLHEWDTEECDEWCLPRRREMKRLDDELRKYWRHVGYRLYRLRAA